MKIIGTIAATLALILSLAAHNRLGTHAETIIQLADLQTESTRLTREGFRVSDLRAQLIETRITARLSDMEQKRQAVLAEVAGLHNKIESISGVVKAPAETIAAVYRVSIFLIMPDGSLRQRGSGSGMAIDKRRVLTAAHVAGPQPGMAYMIDIFDVNGKYVRSVPAKIVRTNDSDVNPELDVALLEAAEDLPHYQPLVYGDAEVNDVIYCIGASAGMSPYHVFFGLLAGKTSVPYPGMYDAAMLGLPGNSGGPVFNAKHEFIGVLVRGVTGGIILFVPAKTVKTFLNAIG